MAVVSVAFVDELYDLLYGDVMYEVTQVAFQVPDEDLRRLDETVPDEFPSRAAALRAVLHEWLERRREAAVDAQLSEGYLRTPEDLGMTAALARVNAEALRDADPDW